jgi:multidrug efflux pump subunit AcrB
MPNHSIDETILQVTDRIEKKLQETPSLDYLKSYTLSGQSTILVVLKESTPPASVPDVWDKVRKFLPALYVAWFRIPETPTEATTVEASAAAK